MTVWIWRASRSVPSTASSSTRTRATPRATRISSISTRKSASTAASCEPECPWEAIFEDEQVPTVFEEDVALNAKIVDERDDFIVPEREDTDVPTTDQIAENKTKWGYDG